MTDFCSVCSSLHSSSFNIYSLQAGDADVESFSQNIVAPIEFKFFYF